MKYLGIIFTFSKQCSGLGTVELHTNLKIDLNMTNLLCTYMNTLAYEMGVLLNETCYH